MVHGAACQVHAATQAGRAYFAFYIILPFPNLTFAEYIISDLRFYAFPSLTIQPAE
jgi:hypothetical protein